MDSQTPSKDSRAASPTARLPNLHEPQEIVVILVRKTPFRLHKNYLCHYSPFFAAAFEGSFAEAESLEMKMDDISPRVFGLLVNWIYSQEISDEEGNLPSCRMLIELWILADRFMMSTLQNLTIEALDRARVEGKPFTASLPQRVYEGTSEDSPLRSYLVDVCIEGTSGSLRETDPPRFLVDVINGMRLRSEAAKKRAGKVSAIWQPPKHRMQIYHVKEDIGQRRGRPSLYCGKI